MQIFSARRLAFAMGLLASSCGGTSPSTSNLRGAIEVTSALLRTSPRVGTTYICRFDATVRWSMVSLTRDMSFHEERTRRVVASLAGSTRFEVASHGLRIDGGPRSEEVTPPGSWIEVVDDRGRLMPGAVASSEVRRVLESLWRHTAWPEAPVAVGTEWADEAPLQLTAEPARFAALDRPAARVRHRVVAIDAVTVRVEFDGTFTLSVGASATMSGSYTVARDDGIIRDLEASFTARPSRGGNTNGDASMPGMRAEGHLRFRADPR